MEVPKLSYGHRILGHWRIKSSGRNTSINTRKYRGLRWDTGMPPLGRAGSPGRWLPEPFYCRRVEKNIPFRSVSATAMRIYHIYHIVLKWPLLARTIQGRREMRAAVACLLTGRPRGCSATAVQNNLLHRSRPVLFQRGAPEPGPPGNSGISMP